MTNRLAPSARRRSQSPARSCAGLRTATSRRCRRSSSCCAAGLSAGAGAIDERRNRMQMYQTSLGLTAGMRLTTERGGPYRLLGISAPFTFQIMGFDMLIIYHQSVVVVSIEYID